MKKEIMKETTYQKAYKRWFASYELERRQQRKRQGAPLTGFGSPPASPASIAELVDRIGARSVISMLNVHRSTLARWLSGECVIPRSAWLVLVLIAEGRLPGMSEDWREWRFEGDRLYLIGTRTSYSARELAGWPYQLAHSEALARRVNELERERDYLLRIGDFEAANDAIAV